eukprot:227794-Heterocapsa_arctica.AAC.1
MRPVPQLLLDGVLWAIPNQNQLPVTIPRAIVREEGKGACRPRNGRAEGTRNPKDAHGDAKHEPAPARL